MHRSLVAVGDSFTEGLDDPSDPASPGTGYRGWADRVADVLAGQAAAEGAAPFRYANLAVRGKLLAQVVDEQVSRVAELGPDLVTIAAGGNDILRRSCDLGALSVRFRDGVRQLAASGAHVLVFAGFDPQALFPGESLVTRARVLRQASLDAADEVGGTVVDLWGVPVLTDRRMWSVDRIHLSALGHERVAGIVLEALGAGDHAWAEPLAPMPPATWLRARRTDAEWTVRHLGPWLIRRARGRSSGDGVTAKRPQLDPWPAEPVRQGGAVSPAGSASPRA